ncbi:hypothetical protein MMC09_003563 [Bachmanniomyces sp. S44760]|nr:hypothetical protein [Bachmanniomyces sp. S44760]
MPQLKVRRDPLWHCLCPLYAQIPLGGSGRLAPANRVLRTQNVEKQQLPRNSAHSSCLKIVPPSPHTRPTLRYFNYRKYPTCLSVETKRLFSSLRDSKTWEHTRSDLLDGLQEACRKPDGPRVRRIIQTLVKDAREKPSANLYNALIIANADPTAGTSTEVARLLEQMVEDGVTPNAGTYHAALRALAIHPNYVLRSQILEKLQERWFTLSDAGWHDVIVGLLRDRQIEMALGTLEEMRKANIKVQPWLYDTVVYVLCDLEEFEEVLKIMQKRYYGPERTISGLLWSHVLDTASKALHHGATLFAWRKRAQTDYLNPSSGVCNNILNTAARHGDFELATDVFRILGRRNAPFQFHQYEALLEAYMTASDLKNALSVLSLMASSGTAPEEATTRPILLFLRKSKSRPVEALAFLREIFPSEATQTRKIPIEALNCIIEASVYQNDMNFAIEVYKELYQLCPSGANTATFNTLFRGCTKASRKDLAMFLASEMVAQGVRPDSLSYDRLMLACIEGGNNDDYVDALRYLEEMKAQGFWPRPGTLVALMKKCCERSDLRVWGVLKEMKGRGTEYEATKLDAWIARNWIEPDVKSFDMANAVEE